MNPMFTKRLAHCFVMIQAGAVILCSLGCFPPPNGLVDPNHPGSAVTPPNLMAGTYNGTLSFNGTGRSYILHVPPRHDGQTALPLVIMLHGGFGSAENAERDYGWPDAADAHGFYSVFPQGLGNVPTWHAEHCCGYARMNNVDDVGFIRNLVVELGKTIPLDAKRIYATGMSNGGMLSHRLGAEAADLFAAIAPVAGTLGGQVNQNSPVVVPPTPNGPISVILFHGTDDQNVLFNGGPSQSSAASGRIDLSVNDAVQFWIAANQTASTPLVESIAGGAVTKSFYSRNGTFAEVALYAVIGQGHAWPGGQQPYAGADAPSTAISATETIWQFFEAHPKP